MNDTRQLHVLYKLPSGVENLEGTLLSFLPPADEERCITSNTGYFVSGREAANKVRETARLAYIDIVARVGSTSCSGQTLRQALEIAGMGNPWWYNPFSTKHVELDDTFCIMLHIFAILDVAKQEQAKTIFLYSSLPEIANALSRHHDVITVNRKNAIDYTKIRFLIRGLAARLMYFCKAIIHHVMLKHYIKNPDTGPDIIFQGFWDWSVAFEMNGKELKDRYFKELPGKCISEGIKCCWFVWFDPDSKPYTKKRSFADILKFKNNNKNIVFLQNYLTLSDIVKAVFDYRPLYRYIRFRRKMAFRSLFKRNNIDFWQVMEHKIFYGFYNTALPHYNLMETACKRAFKRLKPKVAVTFQELFLSSRAFYSGARAGSPNTILCNIQHASYNREKLFLAIDKNREFDGNPDMLPIPKPDFVFAMGELGRSIFLESGFPPEQVLLTGSPRYDSLKIDIVKKNHENNINVLLVATLNSFIELEMIQAVVAASSNLKRIKLFLRSHPFLKLEKLAAYQPYKERITSTVGKELHDDLKEADLVIFTYSTVAEEAVLNGIPVFQWLPANYNGSVFRDIPVIPCFSSVRELRETLKQFMKYPDYFRPSEQVRTMILRQCFYKADGKSCERITNKILVLLNSNNSSANYT